MSEGRLDSPPDPGGRRWTAGRRGRGVLLGLVLLVLLVGGARHRPAPVLGHEVRAAHPYRIRGALHVHTGLSDDARGSVSEVARAARAAGLDFLAIADHGTQSATAAPAFRDGVLVLGGLEKSTDAGHALVMGAPLLPFRLDGDPDTVVSDAESFGGFVIAAHPTSRQSEGRWTGGFEGIRGVEIVNFAEPQAWPERGAGLLWPLLRYLADPTGTLLRAFRFNREAVLLWDIQLRSRPVAGVLGSDAHGGFPTGRLFVPLPSHDRVFGLASQHLILREPFSRDADAAARQVLEAARIGRGYVGFDALAPASGFAFEAEAMGRRALMGENLPLLGDATIRASADAPTGTTLVLLRDGKEVARGASIRHTTREPGVYRVEAYLDRRWMPGGNAFPWILSNPIHVFAAKVLEARARRADLPPPDREPPALAREILDDFEATPFRPGWQVDKSVGAQGSIGPDHGALRFDFALGSEARSHSSICDWTERDLTTSRVLRFRVRSDRPLRFDVQVRTIDEGPAGVRVWRRSVRSDRDWSGVVVPFASLKTYDRRGGRPDLRRVRGVYFHVDEANLPPASRGTLWIDDLELGS